MEQFGAEQVQCRDRGVTEMDSDIFALKGLGVMYIYLFRRDSPSLANRIFNHGSSGVPTSLKVIFYLQNMGYKK